MSTESAKLDRAKLQRLRDLFQRKFDLPLEAVKLDGAAVDIAPERRSRQPICMLMRRNPTACAHCEAEHRRAVEWAFSVGEPYCFICHAGLIVTCTPLADGPQRLGALLTGKTLPERPSDEIVLEIYQRLRPYGFETPSIRAAISQHRHLAGEVLQESADSVFVLAQSVLALDVWSLRQQREHTHQQAQIAQTIHAVKRSSKAAPYPYEREKDLIEKVKLGDRLGAKGVLNEILGFVLFHNPMGSAVLKTRLVELLAVLSRAAAEADVDVNKVLERNLVYFREILNSDSDSALCMSISKALNEFLETVCVRRDTQTETPVTAVMRYIEEHYARQLTVEELAQQAHLSPSRIAHLFQEKLGTTLMDTVTHVRLDQARKLLLETNLSCTEIAYRAGYNDQSYFTRVFRQRHKVTPRQFRVLNRQALGVERVRTRREKTE